MLLDCLRCDLLDDADRLVPLRTDPIDAVLSLQVLHLTEALLHEEHRVRSGERDTLRAGTQGEQDDARAAALEGVDGLTSLICGLGPGDEAVRDLGVGE